MPKGIYKRHPHQGFQKGHKVGMTGKFHSEATKRKIVETRMRNGSYKHTEETKKKIRGSKSVHWKGGRIKTTEGYIKIHQPSHPFCDGSGYVFKHRLVIEKQTGHYLFPKGMPHHLNKIKTDNRPKNLMAFVSRSAHNRFHKNPDNVKLEEIIYDGRKEKCNVSLR